MNNAPTPTAPLVSGEAPSLLSPERLAEIDKLQNDVFFGFAKFNAQGALQCAARDLLSHIAALEAALEVEKAKTALLWPVATKQTLAPNGIPS